MLLVSTVSSLSYNLFSAKSCTVLARRRRRRVKLGFYAIGKVFKFEIAPPSLDKIGPPSLDKIAPPSWEN